MTGDIETTISHDLQQLATDLGTWLTASEGGSLLANRERAADYLVSMHMKGVELRAGLLEYMERVRRAGIDG